MKMHQEARKLSVILPIYKVEPYIRMCLDSIVGQTYRNLEIILVDDGSPDNCGKICDEYAEKDKRIIVIHKQNGGVQAARNDGMAIATGEWITFVDPDDWCEKDYYEQLFNALDERDVDVFCSGGCFIENGNRSFISHSYNDTFIYGDYEKMEDLMAKVLAPCYGNEGDPWPHGYGPPWDKIYKAEFLKKNGLQFDRTCKIHDDVWFNYQVFDKAEHAGICAYAGYHYRVVSTSITHNFDSQAPIISYGFIKKLHAYRTQHTPNAILRQAFRVASLSSLRYILACYCFHPQNPRPYHEIEKEIKDMKTWPYFHEAIYNRNNQYLTKKRIVLKYLLRLPCVWPLKMAFNVIQRMK